MTVLLRSLTLLPDAGEGKRSYTQVFGCAARSVYNEAEEINTKLAAMLVEGEVSRPRSRGSDARFLPYFLFFAPMKILIGVRVRVRVCECVDDSSMC